MRDYGPMLILAGVCWAFRLVFIVVVPAHRLPAMVRTALGYLAPSVLAALVAVETDASARAASPTTGACVVAAVVLMGLVAWRTRNLLWTITTGAGAVLLLDVVLR